MIHFLPEHRAGNAYTCVFWETKPSLVNTTLAGKTAATIQELLVGLSSKTNTILISYRQVFKELTVAFVRNWNAQYWFWNF